MCLLPRRGAGSLVERTGQGILGITWLLPQRRGMGSCPPAALEQMVGCRRPQPRACGSEARWQAEAKGS